MGIDRELGRAFSASRPTTEVGLEDPALEDALARAWARAQQGWPSLSVSAASLAEHLGETIDAEGGALLEALEQCEVADVYLALGCARGDADALTAFESLLDAHVTGKLRQMGLTDAERDEVRQQLRIRLLTADGTRGARIVDFTGKGPLRNWLRVSAVRMALNLRRGGHRVVSDEDVIEAFADPQENAETTYFRKAHREAFTRCMGRAFRGLPRRQRNLLRHHHLDGLRILELARLFRVHRVTASRWLRSAQSDLLSGFHDALSQEVGVPTADLPDVLGSVEPEIDVSIRTLLRSSRLEADPATS